MYEKCNSKYRDDQATLGCLLWPVVKVCKFDFHLDESLPAISPSECLPTSTMEKAQRLFLTFLDQWSTGCNAKIQFHSECGRLMVNLKADLGTWKAGCGLNKAS